MQDPTSTLKSSFHFSGKAILLEVREETARKCESAASQLSLSVLRATDLDEARQHINDTLPVCVVVPATSVHLIAITKQEHSAFNLIGKVLIDEESKIDFLRNIGWHSFSNSANIQEIKGEIGSALEQADALKEKWRQLEEFKDKLDLLSEDEMKVLSEVYQGKLNKQIASKFEVSIRTVEQRRHKIFSKMDVSSAIPLVAQFAAYQLLTRHLYRHDEAHTANPLASNKLDALQSLFSRLGSESTKD